MAQRITITAEEFAEKHARRLKAAIPDIQKGIEKVTESPTAKAAAKQDKMRTNLNNAIDSGKWAASLRRVSTEEWKSKFLTKGVQRISAGIDAAHDKVVSFAEQLISHEQGLLNTVSQMPDLTTTDSDNRMLAWSAGMRKFQRK